MEFAFVCEFVPTVKMITNRIRHYNLVRWIILMAAGLFYMHNVLFPAIFYLSYGFDPQWAFFALIGILFPIYSLFFCQITAYFSVRQYKKPMVPMADPSTVSEKTLKYRKARCE